MWRVYVCVCVGVVTIREEVTYLLCVGVTLERRGHIYCNVRNEKKPGTWVPRMGDNRKGRVSRDTQV